MGIPISNMMDKYTTNIASSQIGFITFIIQPSFHMFSKLCLKCEYLLKNLELNRRNWEELKTVFE